MRVACPARRRLSGVNPCPPSRDNPGVLSDVLSISEMGRRRQTSPAAVQHRLAARPCWSKQVQILSRGFGPQSAYARTNSGVRLDRLVQPRLAWGARDAATRATGPVIGFGDPLKRRTVKSSTTKGPPGLASEFNRRRCRTAKDHCRWVSGCFSFRPAEIMSVLLVETMLGREPETYDDDPRGNAR